MKAFVCAIILLIIISVASFMLSAYADEALDEIISINDQIKLDGNLNEKTKKAIEKSMEIWKKNENLFHITINRNEIMNTKKEIASALGACKVNSTEDFLTAIERLAVALDNIKSYTKLRVENIF